MNCNSENAMLCFEPLSQSWGPKCMVPPLTSRLWGLSAPLRRYGRVWWQHKSALYHPLSERCGLAL